MNLKAPNRTTLIIDICALTILFCMKRLKTSCVIVIESCLLIRTYLGILENLLCMSIKFSGKKLK
jgi:hypothetical protein